MVILVQEIECLAVEPTGACHDLKHSEACGKGNAELTHCWSSAIACVKYSKDIGAPAPEAYGWPPPKE